MCAPFGKFQAIVLQPDGVVIDAAGRITAVVETKVPSGGEPRAIDDNYLVQVIVQCACVGVTHGYFASLGKHKILIQRISFDVDVWHEDLRDLLADFHDLAAQEFISNVLPARDAAYLKQVLRDYKRNISAPRLYSHGLKVT